MFGMILSLIFDRISGMILRMILKRFGNDFGIISEMILLVSLGWFRDDLGLMIYGFHDDLGMFLKNQNSRARLDFGAIWEFGLEWFRNDFAWIGLDRVDSTGIGLAGTLAHLDPMHVID